MSVAIGIIIGLILINIRLIILLNKTEKAYNKKANAFNVMYSHVRNVIILYHQFKDCNCGNEGLFHFLKEMDKELKGVI